MNQEQLNHGMNAVRLTLILGVRRERYATRFKTTDNL